MPLPVLRSPAARADLLRVWATIAADSETAADRMLRRLERSFALLAETPLAGPARPELGEGLRSLAVFDHVVFYSPTPEAVAILRVVAGRLDPGAEAHSGPGVIGAP